MKALVRKIIEWYKVINVEQMWELVKHLVVDTAKEWCSYKRLERSLMRKCWKHETKATKERKVLGARYVVMKIINENLYKRKWAKIF